MLLGFVWVAGPALDSLTGIGMAGPLLVFTSFSLPLGAASTVLIARQRRTLDFRPLAIRSVLSRLVGGAIGVAVTVLGHGVWGLGAQWVAMACANFVLLLLLTPAVPRPGFYRAETTQLLRFGVPCLASTLMLYSSRRLFVFGIGVALGPELAGYLSLGFRVVDMLWALCASAIGQVSLPLLARMQGDRQLMIAAWQSGARITALLLYPVFVTLAVAAPDLVTVLFGARWAGAAAVVSILSIAILLQLPQFLGNALLKANGLIGWSVVAPAVEICLVAVFIAAASLYREVGTASAPVIAGACWFIREMIVAFVSSWVLRRQLGLTPRRLGDVVGRPFLLAVSAGLAIALTTALLSEETPAAARLAIGSLAALGTWLVAAWYGARNDLLIVKTLVWK